MTDLIEFEVVGKAATQGSIAYHSVEQADGSTRFLGHHDNKKLKPWRARVAANARIAMQGRPPWTGAVILIVKIGRKRPKSHYDSRGSLKDKAPSYPTTRPDTLKQVRAVEDALTGIVWLDDSQVVEHHLQKQFCESHKVLIAVTRRD